MKKSLLIAMAGFIGVSAYAQNRAAHQVQLYPVQKTQKAAVDKNAARSGEQNLGPVQSPSLPSAVAQPSVTRVLTPGSITETTIGQTIYDSQSNRGVGRRIANTGGGTLNAVWTMAPVAGTISGDRGTGYNYFNGSAWGAQPTSRIETVRTGFTNVFVSNGVEYVSAHTGAAGVLLTQRPTVGSGAWTQTTVGTYNLLPSQADVWSRVAVGGPNDLTVHVIVNSQGTGTTPVLNMNGPLTYSRSLDGGVTWPIDHIQLPGATDAEFLGFSAENYAIDARGTTVVIVAGGAETDLVMWKSIDNGDTWTRTTIFAYPLGPLYDETTTLTDVDGDGVADTLIVPGQDITVSLDNNSMAHIAVGGIRQVNDDGTAMGYFFGDQGIWYWNESQPVWTSAFLAAGSAVIAASQDYNGNDTIDLPDAGQDPAYGGYGFFNMSLHPSIGFDANNDVYVAYAAVNELADTTVHPCAHRHIYVIRSGPGGTNFGTPQNIMPDPTPGNGVGEYMEGVWPSIQRDIDGSGANTCATIVYQRDENPYVSSLGGTLSTTAWVATQQGWNNNATASAALPNDIIAATVCNLTTGVKNINTNVTSVVVSPNPAKNFVTVEFSLNKPEDVTFQLTDVVGRLVMEQSLGTINSGSNKRHIDISKMKSGIYVYSLTSVQGVKSGKLVIE